jgi:hypothetical protein
MKDEKAVLGKIEAMVAGQLSQLQVCWIELKPGLTDICEDIVYRRYSLK